MDAHPITTHLKTSYKHYQLICEHAILPIHMMMLEHWYTAAAFVAGTVTLVYLVASLAKAKA